MGKRKYGIVLLFLLMLTGCGGKNNTLTCRKSENLNGIKMDQTALMKTKNDKISYVNMEITATGTNDNIKKSWATFVKTLNEEYKEKKDKGITIKTKNDNKNYSYNIKIEIDLSSVEKENLKEYNLENITTKKQTLEKIEKKEEQEGYTCKIK